MRDIALQCGGKERHTRAKAAAHARNIRSRGGQVDVYHCDRCGGWHVGHRPGQRREMAMLKTRRR